MSLARQNHLVLGRTYQGLQHGLLPVLRHTALRHAMLRTDDDNEDDSSSRLLQQYTALLGTTALFIYTFDHCCMSLLRLNSPHDLPAPT
jgi:hypothetical protein